VHYLDEPVKPPAPFPEGPRVRTAERLAAPYKIALALGHIKPRDPQRKTTGNWQPDACGEHTTLDGEDLEAADLAGS
jgi:hypothetical protein